MIKNLELSELIGTLLGQPEQAMRGNVAILREAGYLAKAGRGLWSADMGYTDAANLLVASIANASGARQKFIVDRLVDFRSLKVRGLVLDGGFAQWFVGCTNFGDYLEALLASGGRLRAEAAARAGGPVDDLTTPLACTVEMDLPSWGARIKIAEHTSPGIWTDKFRVEFTVDAGRIMEARYQRSTGDLRVRADIGFRTIVSIFDAIETKSIVPRPTPGGRVARP